MMAENSKIEWTDHTFNPWVGCTKVSPGCDNCYAEFWAKRTGNPDLWSGKRRRTKTWNDPVRWNREAEGTRKRVFCASLADVFDNEAPEEWRWDLFNLIRNTPNLDWLLLTKRIGNVHKFLPEDWGNGYQNVWLGATIVNQDEADRDIPKLLNVPARVRFLSMEPLLGPVDLLNLSYGGWPMDCLNGTTQNTMSNNFPIQRIDWVIVGGESGGKARPTKEEWALHLRDQCVSAGVAFHFKQWGGTNKKQAGRLLDGRTWDQFPV